MMDMFIILIVGHGFMDAHMSTLFKWYILNMCRLFHLSYTLIKLLNKKTPSQSTFAATISLYFIPEEKLDLKSSCLFRDFEVYHLSPSTRIEVPGGQKCFSSL